LDSVLAARTTSFLAGTLVPSCRLLEPILEKDHVGLNGVVSGANLRGMCSNRAPTENDTVTAKTMVVDDK
jgi:hypothetical protein